MESLIVSYSNSPNDTTELVFWLSLHKNDEQKINELAVSIARKFIEKEISFEIANGLLNDIMPVLGFEEAPKIFWTIYVGFENFETSESPEKEIRKSISNILNDINTI
jgi:hypothetical protein